jgi:hypothetical protein
MAGTRDVLDALTALAETTLLPLPGLPPTIIRSGWPPINVIQDTGSGGRLLVSAFVTGRPRHTTRWAPGDIVLTQVTPGVTVTVSTSASGQVQAGGQATITLGGTVIANDGIGLLARAGRQETAVSVLAAAGDTAATLAVKLQAVIAASPVLPTWLLSSVTGSVVTLTNRLGLAIVLQTPIGNIANAQQEVWRIMRSFSLHLWAPNESLRHMVGDALASALATLASNFGPTFADGTMARLWYEGDDYNDTEMLLNLYRRDFYTQVEYGVLALDVLYPVLAPGLKYEIEPPDATMTNTIVISPGP